MRRFIQQESTLCWEDILSGKTVVVKTGTSCAHGALSSGDLRGKCSEGGGQGNVDASGSAAQLNSGMGMGVVEHFGEEMLLKLVVGDESGISCEGVVWAEEVPGRGNSICEGAEGREWAGKEMWGQESGRQGQCVQT